MGPLVAPDGPADTDPNGRPPEPSCLSYHVSVLLCFFIASPSSTGMGPYQPALNEGLSHSGLGGYEVQKPDKVLSPDCSLLETIPAEAK